MKKAIFISILTILNFCLFAQIQPPSPFSTENIEVFALTEATVVVKSGQEIQNCTLILRNGKIEQVGSGIPVPADARVISLKGKTIYPGFIEPFASGWTKSVAKPGEPGKPAKWNPNVKPELSVFENSLPDEKIIEKFRSAGFTTAQFVSSDGIIRGKSSILDLGTGSPEKEKVSGQVAQTLSISLPGIGPDPNSEMGAIALIRQSFFDADWYAASLETWKKNPGGNKRPENDSALEQLASDKKNGVPFYCNAADELQIQRFSKLADELKFNAVYVASGKEFRWLDALSPLKSAQWIVPVIIPKAPDVSSPEKTAKVLLDDLLFWDFAPENPALLFGKGFRFSLTSKGLPDGASFLTNLRLSVKRGLPENEALKSITETPAKLLGISATHGTLEAGKTANLVVMSGNFADDKTQVSEVWINGKRSLINPETEPDFRGTFGLDSTAYTIQISGKIKSPAVTLKLGAKSVPLSKILIENNRLSGVFVADSLGGSGLATLSAIKTSEGLGLTLNHPDGKSEYFTSALKTPFNEVADPDKEKQPVDKSSFPLTYPFGSFGRSTAIPDQPKTIMVKNATIWTAGKDGNLDQSDLLVENGKITKTGENLSIPAGAVVIDGTGKHVTPGLIDAHSHTAISSGVNETGQPVTAEVRIEDVVDPSDIAIYYQLAGGVTTSNQMHGSANAIGGQTNISKWRWGQPAEELKLKGAYPGIKFALGENPKQSNWGDGNRYPRTRMGVYETIRDDFIRAKEYKKNLETWNKTKKGVAPRRNLELETLVEILDGKRGIQCHSYVQSEILALMRIGEELGFKVKTFQHILEGYKVAGEMAKHGAGGSAFSDWWAYKYEVIDAIPYNGPIMHQQGVVVSYNSDSDEMARRLNTEAAKAVKYGGLEPEEAIKFITINAAINLGIEKQTGSLEAGKDADFVIWNGNPLSTFSKPEQTWIDGRKYFDLQEDEGLRKNIKNKKQVLTQKILKSGVPMDKSDKGKPANLKIDRCMEVFDEHTYGIHGENQ
ncbi:MAG: amidohydrolase family protein [Bacteroidetes bacterium]|nr:amidohydrolase family protein [Bacteroidota bacterium]